jgi:hypothetical protein
MYDDANSKKCVKSKWSCSAAPFGFPNALSLPVSDALLPPVSYNAV